MENNEIPLSEQVNDTDDAVEKAVEDVIDSAEDASCDAEDIVIDTQNDQSAEALDITLNAENSDASSQEDLERKNKIKKRRKIFKVLYIIMLGVAIFLTSVLMIAGLIALSDANFDWDYPPNMEQVDDDFVITDMTDSQIVRTYDNFIAQNHRFVGKGFEYSGVNYEYSKYDRNETYFEATQLNGIKTVSMTYVDNAKLILSIDSNTTADFSKIKIVITSSSDGEIIGTYNANERHYIVLTPEKATTYSVKIIGEDADVKITVNRLILDVDQAPTT